MVGADEKEEREAHIPYDAAKAKNLMLQCDQHSRIIRSMGGEERTGRA